jgi:hypothetical protein
MRLFTETVALHSVLPPDVLLDRIRGLAEGRLPMPPQPSWRAPVRWSLRELPDAIRLMPLSPPYYREQQASFTGTIDAVGSGSTVRGRIRPYALTIGLTVFGVFATAAVSTAGVIEQLSRHSSRSATLMALIGFGIGAAAVVMLRFSASFDAGSIRQLLETAASSDER